MGGECACGIGMAMKCFLGERVGGRVCGFGGFGAALGIDASPCGDTSYGLLGGGARLVGQVFEIACELTCRHVLPCETHKCG